ncbi:uncharacterized protein ARMOST_06103 [Armillaria ostoyae]|uniref:Uncharacterized protein n=1 Tax=Armillaria ostoyae TaxID=47428 RepID=A0A284R212_ARMOS|nr:uncharacterized protein ARMOST_06103 [Armillaria ostoyae]
MRFCRALLRYSSWKDVFWKRNDGVFFFCHARCLFLVGGIDAVFSSALDLVIHIVEGKKWMKTQFCGDKSRLAWTSRGSQMRLESVASVRRVHR